MATPPPIVTGYTPPGFRAMIAVIGAVIIVAVAGGPGLISVPLGGLWFAYMLRPR